MDISSSSSFTQVSKWLKGEGVSREVCKKFEGELTHAQTYNYIYIYIYIYSTDDRVFTISYICFVTDYESKFTDPIHTTRFFANGIDPVRLLWPFSPTPSFTTDSNDTASLFTASTITSSSVNIPDTWWPPIMACLKGDLDTQKKTTD